MMNQKQKHTFIQATITIILLLLIGIMPSTAFGGSKQKSSLLSYDVTLNVTGEGSLYWDYGENMSFFLEEDDENYSSNCKVKNHSTYHFSKSFDRGLIPKPKEGYYFAGFYKQNGEKAKLTKTTIDILRVSIDGIYYYDYYDAYTNSKFKNYTETAYKNKVKTYLKTLYGTSRYKVMDTTILYEMPKKDASYVARFQAKKAPAITSKEELTKTYGNKIFYIIPNRPKSYTYTFKSSNRNVISIEKTTGQSTIKGPGTAVITCTVDETETTLPAKFTTTITVKPANVKAFQASQSKKTLRTSWSKQSKNSGYEIQVSNNKSFSTILASKTIRSAQANSAKITLKTELFNNYARIRAFKLSKGEKIYSEYTIVKIKR